MEPAGLQAAIKIVSGFGLLGFICNSPSTGSSGAKKIPGSRTTWNDKQKLGHLSIELLHISGAYFGSFDRSGIVVSFLFYDIIFHACRFSRFGDLFEIYGACSQVN
jgi:hypothetical protein